MNDIPLSLQLSGILFPLGVFLLILCAGMWLIDLVPGLERFLDRLLGGDE